MDRLRSKPGELKTVNSKREPLSPNVQRLRYFVSFASLFSIVVGLLGLVGWAFGIAVLKTILRGNVAIKPNAAIGFVLIGISLWLLSENWGPNSLRARTFGGQALAVLVVLIGLLSLAEYLLDWDPGIDQLLFHGSGADAFGSVRPGLMAPITALDFVLLGAALILLDRSIWGSNWLAQVLSCAAATAAIFAVLDFVLDQEVSHTHIALQASAALFLVACAVVCARTGWGLGALIVGSGPGNALIRRLLPASVAIPVVIGWVSWIGFRQNLWTGVAASAVLSALLLAALSIWSALAIARNDDEQQRTAQALGRSERRYRLLFENSLDGYAYCEMRFDQNGQPADFVYLEVNRDFETITGLKNVAGKCVTEVIPGIRESHPELFETFGRVAMTGAPERLEIDFQPLGKWLSVAAYSPEERFVVAVFDDITERKHSESVSRQLAAIVESSQDAIVAITVDGTVTNWNAGAERLYLYRADEAIGRSITFLYPPEAELPEVLNGITSGQAIQNLETQRLRKDGTVIDVSLTVSPMRNRAGEPVGVSSIARDNTGRKKAEEQLRLQAAAMAATANSIVITDRIGEILWVNPAFTRLTGYEYNEVVGHNPRVLKSGKHDRTFYDHMWKAIVGGQVWQGEVINRRKDGSFYTEEMTITPVSSADGAIRHFIAIKQDVTARNLLEEQLRQSQKMEAVGRLAGGVAHDFNNMLMVITGYGELLGKQLEYDNRLHGMTSEILKAANRAASLTRQLLAFSRKQTLSPSILDLNTVIADMGKMIPRLLGEDVELQIVHGNNLGQVIADASQMQQVIMNLVVNARDAMPEGGTLTIETDSVELGESYARTHDVTMEPGRYVMLAVSDSGEGMDRETQAHIFEPFFTTKDAEKGTGLGLSIVYGVVKQSGGFIWVYSEPGQGTTFKIYLPRVEGQAKGSATAMASQKELFGSETILLVEDEQGVREAILHFLHQRGYTVLEADRPRIAMEIAKEHHGPIHLLLTDIVMPDMNGLELAKKVKAYRPTIKVLYMSGYTDRGLGGGATIGEDVHVLQKPFGFEVLGRRLRDILDR